ncbi:MAG: hypothetical protein JNJ77_19880 [Planctomycetia bacterium]|nr:hypothetical protein [Planctomycetia bacterium]
MGDRDKLWEAMLAVGPNVIPLFLQQQPNLAGGVNMNFDMNAWAGMVAKVAETLVNTHQKAVAVTNGVPTP